ncbi:MAG: hypothetical protein R3B47_02930 [Bacteroidia bacterium]
MEENIDNTEFNVNKMCEALGYSHIQFIRKNQTTYRQKAAGAIADLPPFAKPRPVEPEKTGNF